MSAPSLLAGWVLPFSRSRFPGLVPVMGALGRSPRRVVDVRPLRCTRTHRRSRGCIRSSVMIEASPEQVGARGGVAASCSATRTAKENCLSGTLGQVREPLGDLVLALMTSTVSTKINECPDLRKRNSCTSGATVGSGWVRFSAVERIGLLPICSHALLPQASSDCRVCQRSRAGCDDVLSCR
jgi:hypothetical protein